VSLNDEFAAAREAGEEYEGALVGAYLQAIRKAGRTAADRFEDRAVLIAAANWMPPEISDVMAFAVSADRIRASQRTIMGAITGRVTDIPGVSFDALVPPTQRQLEKLGLRAAVLAGDIRQSVGDAIARAWAEGRSVPQAAALIRSTVNTLAPARAIMLARTDLISLSNGANQAVVGILNEAAAEAGEDPAVQSKTWLATNDARTRPTHSDADGQTVPFDQPYDVGGEDLMYPGDPDGSDEEVINCRCTELYSDEAATSASTSELPPEAEVPVFASVAIDYGKLHRLVARRVLSGDQG
jgi:Phage Mu protein F like protein